MNFSFCKYKIEIYYIENILKLSKTKIQYRKLVYVGTVISAIFAIIILKKALPYPIPKSSEINLSPSLDHLLGTDHLGRDILYLSFYASIKTLYKTIVVWGVSLIIGVILGIMSSIYYERSIDKVITFLAEFIRAFPGLLLILVFLSFYKNISGVLVLMFWTIFWRNSRALTYEFIKSPVFESALGIGHNSLIAALLLGTPMVAYRFVIVSLSTVSDILGAFIALDFLSLTGKNEITLGTLFSNVIQGIDGFRLFLSVSFMVLIILWGIHRTIIKISGKT